MKKMKKFGAILAAGALSLGVCAFAACGGDNDDSNNTPTATEYTLVVKTANGQVMKNYEIMICIMENGEKGACLPSKATDANGKVVFDAPAGTYGVSDADEGDNITLADSYTLTDYGTYEIIVNIAS